MDSVGLSANESPIFFTDVVIDLDWAIAAIQGVTAIAFRAGDPIVLAGCDVEIVRFEASTFEALKLLAAIVKGATSLRERDASDARYAGESTGFAFDVHDAAGASCSFFCG